MTQLEVLQAIADGKISAEEGAKQLPSGNGYAGKLTPKVSRKGALSVYGLQRMPVTLYPEQWERLLEGCPADHFVLAYIKEWEGKEFKGTGTLDGKKDVPYTATLSRKAA